MIDFGLLLENSGATSFQLLLVRRLAVVFIKKNILYILYALLRISFECPNFHKVLLFSIR